MRKCVNAYVLVLHGKCIMCIIIAAVFASVHVIHMISCTSELQGLLNLFPDCSNASTLFILEWHTTTTLSYVYR